MMRYAEKSSANKVRLMAEGGGGNALAAESVDEGADLGVCHGDDVLDEKERAQNRLAGDPNGQDLMRGTASCLHEAL